jgi:hypothetical protein
VGPTNGVKLVSPSISHSSNQTKKKGQSHSNPTFRTKHEKGWSRPQNEGRLRSAPLALQPNTRLEKIGREEERWQQPSPPYIGVTLPSCPTALGPCRHAPRRQDPATVPHSGRSLALPGRSVDRWWHPYRCAPRRQEGYGDMCIFLNFFICLFIFRKSKKKYKKNSDL